MKTEVTISIQLVVTYDLLYTVCMVWSVLVEGRVYIAAVRSHTQSVRSFYTPYSIHGTDHTYCIL